MGSRRTRLISACAALAGVGAEDVTLGALVLTPEQDTGQRLRHRLIGATIPAGGEPLSESPFAMPQALENNLVFMLAAQFVPTVRRGVGVNDRNGHREPKLRTRLGT